MSFNQITIAEMESVLAIPTLIMAWIYDPMLALGIAFVFCLFFIGANIKGIFDKYFITKPCLMEGFQLYYKKKVIIQAKQENEPFEVQSKEGLVKGKAGDYRMIGIQGEEYICDKQIFEETYEKW